jgi:ribosome-binding protein aMBF1 (putative translation factor)
VTSSEELIQEAQDAVASLQRSHRRLCTEVRRTGEFLRALEQRRDAMAADAPGHGLEEVLRANVRTVLIQSGLSQAAIARQLGITAKHLSQMLTGRATLTVRWAERIASVCGWELVITSRPIGGNLTVRNF